MGRGHDRGRSEDWPLSSKAHGASATLRPPKRLVDDDSVSEGGSPKRLRPSPSPSPSRSPLPSPLPNLSWPTPRSESELALCTSADWNVPPSTVSVDIANGSHDPVPVHVPSPRDVLVLPMDWTPTSKTGGTLIHADDVAHDSELDSDPRICYGALCDAKARFESIAKAKRLLSGKRRFCLLRVVLSGPHYVLSTRANTVVAQLDLATSRALRTLRDLRDVDFAGIIENTALSQNQRTGIVPLSINVYGPFSYADQVGSVLSAASAFLQHPFFLEPSCVGYFNPQLFRPGNQMQDLTHLVGLNEQDLKAKTVSDEIQHILDSLDDIALTGDDADAEISWEPQHLIARLTECVLLFPKYLTLLIWLNSHQVTALNFIQQRENRRHCQRLHQRLRHLTDIPPQLNIPSYSTGGILADVIGLGKTLTMISTILSTLDISRQYSIGSNAVEYTPRTGATLVVVTSVQVLHVWETEIRKHVKPNTLSVCKFHGENRPTSPGDLANFDIVLTTYATLSSDHKKRGSVHQVEWYRIVLDEAHWIRNQTSKQFKAAATLQAERRWCLTGTPIQNSLNDLVSLLGFLHLEPFSSPAIFQRHILAPLAAGTENGGYRLKQLLRTICLRRDERLLNLPEPQFEMVEVILHEEEKALYDGIFAQCARELDEIVSSVAKKKRYNVLFTAIVKLRRLCNHGTFTTLSVATPAAEANSSLESLQGCQFCSGADEDRLELVSQDGYCLECGRELLSTTSSRTSASRLTLGFGNASNRLNAPSPELVLGDGTSGKDILTKVQTVVNRLSQTENGSKSLVFSYWTATLDLLEKHLKTRGLAYLRIDGNVAYTARLRILEEFRATDVPILLMTVETGAVGLNLTAANYVHIVEPQWNPSVEEQAIARAVRMGQTRTVTVIRYVVKNSVEENIVRLQRRKRNLAKFALGEVSQEGASGVLDDLRFVLDLDFAG